ncbi:MULTISPECIES: hypothetical protein [unclassified Salinivibrio]|uniref:hypothetical protein n=1 Tax=unclassified Salinivibrio TaxID=2636825 RepID=UPI00128E6C8A|nr:MULTISPECIES: hypothetical protein [unclassified Salinivibrio]MPS33440.1 hypothetical protein [Salinivibrio sp. VYel7]MPX91723.1 hypothetical protein [Salinivibrio sp. VYel1]MPX94824.1 hypothetical protein [Salinivibrio sp. VYel9]MPX97593.1 hypothetical protein [Salinivibrio sp. VYel6]MPY01111.1 hypothetical protein [Salinivibrio sp. VYel4]
MSQAIKLSHQSGRGWLEALLLVSILSVLVVIAIPKFYDYEADANVSALKGLKSGIETVMAHTHALATKHEISRQATQSLSVNGTQIDIAYGYPAISALPKLVTTLQDATRWRIRRYPEQDRVDFIWLFHDQPATACYLTYREATASTKASTQLVIHQSCQSPTR